MKMTLFATLLELYANEYAQWKTQQSPETKELDPVTVSSSLDKVNISQSGRNIIYIKGEEFSKLPLSYFYKFHYRIFIHFLIPKFTFYRS